MVLYIKLSCWVIGFVLQWFIFQRKNQIKLDVLAREHVRKELKSDLSFNNLHMKITFVLNYLLLVKSIIQKNNINYN